MGMSKKTLYKIIVLLCVVILAIITKDSSEITETVIQQEQATLVRVVDGDTVLVRIDGKEQSVRLIGVDAPEVKGPYAELECYGNESKDYLSELLPTEDQVILEYDDSQGRYDKYDRILAYIFLGEKNIGEYMIQNGYAQEFTYKRDYRYQSAFRAAENFANMNDFGLWSECNL
jgi:micrococcal nuclease